MSYHYEESMVALPKTSRQDAMKRLFDNQEKTAQKIAKELPVFQYYVNLAIKNIQEIYRPVMDDSQYDGDKIKSKFKEMLTGENQEKKRQCQEVIKKLAHFLWLFQVDNPEEDFGKGAYRDYTLEIIRRIFMIRNFFCHQNESGIDALITNNNFYKFFNGWVMNEARTHSTKAGLKTEDLFKMKLMNLQTICKESKDDDAPFIHSECTYAFTRKGIILLLCMALYKDDAIDFLQQLQDLRRLNKEVEEEILELQEYTENEKQNDLDKLRKKTGGRKAMHEFFTYFSMRRRYNAIDTIDPNFAAFTEIIGYLNKVPLVSMEYLSLQAEREYMDRLFRESNESEDNRETRYKLQRRFKKKMLSFLAAYCEDFGIMPSIAFKRLDTSETIGRKRYTFGMEDATTCRQNRHFAIVNDAIRFEFKPEQHYGDIHIDSLRSSISSSELRRLLIASSCGAINPDTEIKNYFTAYHKILETILTEEDCSHLDREKYMEELKTVTLATEEELRNNDSFLEKMAVCFPESISRFFIPQDNIPDNKQLTEKLKNGLEAEIEKDKRMLDTLEKLRQWKRLSSEEKDEKQDEKVRGFSDGTLIHRVFRTLNLYLKPERRFRQLPRGKCHRGEKDYEYQTMHAIIGRFGTDQQTLWDKLNGVCSIYEYEEHVTSTGNTIPKRRRIGEKPLPPEKVLRQELKEIAGTLKDKVSVLFRKENEYCRNKLRFDANGNVIQARYSLAILAEAAILCHKAYCENKLKNLEDDREKLIAECRKFGIRTGMPLTRDAILKTILHLDLKKWTAAYNYKEDTVWLDRDLKDNGHIVTQIPITNLFTTSRIKNNKNIARLFNDRGHFMFGEALLQRMGTKVKLRDFYDSQTLMDARKTGAITGTAWDETMPEEHRRTDPFPGKRELMEAAKEIADIKYQDLLLLYIAGKYHERYTADTDTAGKNNRHFFDSDSSIYEYFDNEETITLRGGLTFKARPNDRLRFMFAKVQKYAAQLAEIFKELQPDEIPDFYEVTKVFRKIDTSDRRIRLKFQAKLFQLEKSVIEPKINGEKTQEEIRKILYPAYLNRVAGEQKKKAKKFPFEDFNRMVEFRNTVFHNGFNISQQEAEYIDKLLWKVFGIE